MGILGRFLTLSLRENRTELQLSEARRDRVYMMQFDNQPAMKRELKLA
jgi:hypothetical protein